MDVSYRPLEEVLQGRKANLEALDAQLDAMKIELERTTEAYRQKVSERERLVVEISTFQHALDLLHHEAMSRRF